MPAHVWYKCFRCSGTALHGARHTQHTHSDSILKSGGIDTVHCLRPPSINTHTHIQTVFSSVVQRMPPGVFKHTHTHTAFSISPTACMSAVSVCLESSKKCGVLKQHPMLVCQIQTNDMHLPCLTEASETKPSFEDVQLLCCCMLSKLHCKLHHDSLGNGGSQPYAPTPVMQQTRSESFNYSSSFVSHSEELAL